MAIGTLSDIETKVRRLTRSPSTAQLSQADLDTYINTFVLYDFPEHIRTFNLRTKFTFFCNPYQDTYYTDTASYGTNPLAQNNPLYDFQNKYLSIHKPVYVAGFQTFFSQSEEQFFGVFPKVNSVSSIGTTGNGAQTSFSGVINTQQSFIPSSTTQNVALLQNEVTFSSLDANNNGLAMQDVPVINPVTGNPTSIGNLYQPGYLPTTPPTVQNTANYINYVTGAFTVAFSLDGSTPVAPGTGVAINSQTVPTVASLPQGMMFYSNKITLRPVPDQPYRIEFEVYQRPTQLLGSNQLPDLNEWWQYIAYGCAKKIFEDRMDMDSVQLIMQEFKQQERLCLRRTLVQQTNERTSTIFTEQTGGGASLNGWGSAGGNF